MQGAPAWGLCCRPGYWRLSTWLSVHRLPPFARFHRYITCIVAQFLALHQPMTYMTASYPMRAFWAFL
jgi:hypothetical protein